MALPHDCWRNSYTLIRNRRLLASIQHSALLGNRRRSMKTLRKSSLSSIMAGVLLCAAVPRIQAGDLNECQRRVAHAEHELHEAMEKHGRHSRQANHERRVEQSAGALLA